ncbi:sulfurtransferase [Microbacterium sp. A196]|uniref:sulfurtransferase n=1 Tax=unclassified Microbacterium TaxID=2609290 RepID=UPI003FCF18B4
MSHLVSAVQLQQLRIDAEHGAGAPVRLLDVRWRLDRPEGRPEYLRAHLPGAVYVDLEHELSRRGQPQDGQHPLPALEDLQHAARSWGIDDGDIVVAYDDNSSVPAARLWWLLSGNGVDARVLDGGIRAWAAEGLPIEQGDVLPAFGRVTLVPDNQAALTIDDVEDFARRGVLLDVRTPEQYSGARTVGAPVGGHIPGAVNLPALATLDGAGRFRSPVAMQRIFAAVGVHAQSDVAVYCGSGVAAMHMALALAHAGIRARVYPGSWSQWSNTRGRSVAEGILPSGRVSRI